MKNMKSKLKKRLIILFSIFIVLVFSIFGYFHLSRPNYKILLDDCYDYSEFVQDYKFRVTDFHDEYCIVSVKMDDGLRDIISNDERVKLLYRPLHIARNEVNSNYNKEILREFRTRYEIPVTIIFYDNSNITITRNMNRSEIFEQQKIRQQ